MGAKVGSSSLGGEFSTWRRCGSTRGSDGGGGLEGSTRDESRTLMAIGVYSTVQLALWQWGLLAELSVSSTELEHGSWFLRAAAWPVT